MNLETFIAETLTQIIAGVERAQQVAANHGGYIHPVGMGSAGGDRVEWYRDRSGTGVCDVIAFDVAVTATEGTERGGGAGIKVLGIDVGGKGASASSSSTVSRVQFRVPVVLPMQAESQGRR